jgi:thioredoxin 1
MTKKKSFSSLINNSETPVLVDFYANWCGPCHSLSPILQEVARDLSGKIKVIKIDVDKNRHAAEKYQIRGVPTMMLFNKGKILWRQSGVLPKNAITQAVLQRLPKTA